MRVYCGQVNKQHLNKDIELYGWIKKNRKLGGLIFLDLYDKTGIVQIALNDKNKLFDLVHSLSKESVIKVIGKVVERSNPNLELATGKYEISLKELEVISKADNTPFVVSEDTDANEDIRLKYRYLDLRRECVRSKIQLRAKAVQTIRDFLINEAFEEVETPILCRPTPEGAKDYLVPTRNKAKAFFALPQSPQTFKQLLMVAGFDRYFQIARCFRDEPLRSDRQPEFSQVDIEMSFIQESDIQDLIERMMKTLFKKTLNMDIKIPFKRIDFDVAMNEYGCDKPDLRFNNKIQDLSNYFTNTNFKIFKSVVDQKNKIKAVIFEKINAQKSDITKLEKFAKDNGAKGLAWLTVKDNKIVDGSIAKVIEPEIITKILTDQKIKTATLLFVADENEIANKSLGAVRIEAAKSFNIIDESKYEFCWIVNWPLFEYDPEQKRYVAAHHPFTSPTSETLKDFDTNKKDAKARSYDIVLNGYEVGGGSIRIADAQIQQRMFKALELTDKEITNKFGFLIEAFKYGVPIHGGLALGLDRLIMLMTNANSIKDVIAFPKNSAGNDLMLEGPSSLNEDELGELHLKYLDKK